MSILAYGLNYRTAPLALRERVAFPEDSLGAALRDLKHDMPAIAEVAIVSTCNRTELYCAANSECADDLGSWLSQRRDVDLQELQGASYQYWDHDAARHSIRVAAGLDSQMLGEPQIMGQVKSAFALAQQHGTCGPELNLLSRMTIQTAKQVRTQTDIGRNPISVAYAAVSLAAQLFSDLPSKRALLLGAGETVALVGEHLRSKGVSDLTIANRALANAQTLAATFGAKAIQLADIAKELWTFDMVIASTGSTLPVLGKGAVEQAIRERKHRPIFMVDIAVPRDIEAAVGELPDVYLYTIDDLTQLVEVNKARRLQAASGAEDLVDQGTQDYRRERRIQQGQGLLQAYRAQAESVRDGELERALRSLASGADAAATLQKMASTLTNKLIHPTTAAIRHASAEGRTDRLDFIQTTHGLPPQALPDNPVPTSDTAQQDKER
ncbi:MAG: glutamyl-tRNA reductase [Proteobacteria bacterium]|nr:glutamyl-tRNA reductase [Pseudomonadota bacterium]